MGTAHGGACRTDLYLEYMVVSRAATNVDLVSGSVEGAAPGIDLPPDLADIPLARLRWTGAALIDIRGLVRAWHIDPQGRPRLAPAPDRQPLTCAGDDPLTRDPATGVWRVESGADRLAAARARALAAADTAVDRLRAALVTGIAGQNEAYRAKGAELAAWEAAGEPVDPDPAAYPWAADRAALLTGLGTPTAIPAVMAEWRARRAAWTVLLRATERAREAAKARIRVAADGPAAAAAAAALAETCGALAESFAAAAAAGGVPAVPAAVAVLDGIPWP